MNTDLNMDWQRSEREFGGAGCYTTDDKFAADQRGGGAESAAGKRSQGKKEAAEEREGLGICRQQVLFVRVFFRFFRRRREERKHRHHVSSGPAVTGQHCFYVLMITKGKSKGCSKFQIRSATILQSRLTRGPTRCEPPACYSSHHPAS